MDSDSRKFVKVFAICIIAIIIIIFLLDSSQFGSWLMPETPQGESNTPTITMYSEKTGSLNYTFTVAGVTKTNLTWGDILVVVSPKPAYINVPSDTDLISSWDEVIITFSSEVETVVSLVFEPSGGVAYQLIFTPLN
jgi:hypothetical protein